MKSTVRLNVVVAERTSVFQLLACEDHPLLVGRNALFVLNHQFDFVDEIIRLNIQGDDFPRESFDFDLEIAKHLIRCLSMLNGVLFFGLSQSLPLSHGKSQSSDHRGG